MIINILPVQLLDTETLLSEHHAIDIVFRRNLVWLNYKPSNAYLATTYTTAGWNIEFFLNRLNFLIQRHSQITGELNERLGSDEESLQTDLEDHLFYTEVANKVEIEHQVLQYEPSVEDYRENMQLYLKGKTGV